MRNDITLALHDTLQKIHKKYPNIETRFLDAGITDVSKIIDYFLDVYYNFEPSSIPDGTNHIIQSLVYLIPEVYNTGLKDATIIQFDRLYPHALCDSRLTYNYPHFNQLLSNVISYNNYLINAEPENKKDIFLTHLIINSIFACLQLDFLKLKITSHENPIEYVVYLARSKIISTFGTLVNNSHPVYCIDTDFIVTDEISDDLKDAILSIGGVNIEYADFYFISPKKYIVGSFEIYDFNSYNVGKLLKMNKEYLGLNYPEEFPEYKLMVLKEEISIKKSKARIK